MADNEVNSLPSKEEMAKMSHSDLYNLRDKLTTKEAQDLVSPYEHRAFAREYVTENPVTGAIGLAGAIPAYQVAKAAGLTKSRSGASADQVVEAAKGVGEGIANAVENTTPPWEMNLNPIMEKATQAVEAIKSTVKAILPWEQDYGAKRPVAPPVAVPNTPTRPTFDQVFSNMVHTESNGVHTDASGELIKSNLKKDPARGITQLRDSTANNPGYGITPVQDNSKAEYLRVGKQLLNAYTNDLGGDIRKGVAAYNWGIGNLKKAITKYGDNWEQYLPAETKKYLKKVL